MHGGKHGLVALLPLKANSERVRGKNFRQFAGKPLFRWMLDALLSVDEIELIVINTDARGVLEEHGMPDTSRIMIRDRGQEICGDHVSMNLIIADDLQAIDAEKYLMTHTTNPLLSSTTITHALRAYEAGLRSGVNDSLFTVNCIRTRFYQQDGRPINHNPNVLTRTQDLPAWYEENSNLYIFNQESFARSKSRIGALPLLFETPRLESFDIDDESDWIIAESVALQAQNPQGAR